MRRIQCWVMTSRQSQVAWRDLSDHVSHPRGPGMGKVALSSRPGSRGLPASSHTATLRFLWSARRSLPSRPRQKLGKTNEVPNSRPWA